MYYRTFERKPKRHQLSIGFEIAMEQVFENLETLDIDMQQQVLKILLNKFSTETLETHFAIIIVTTGAVTHRNRQAIIKNPDITTNPETSHLHT